jgi:DNA (cytosine-5)-methyltransferase 1
MIKIGSLFSGIGGLDLGLEQGFADAGHASKTVFQVEIEDFPHKVLQQRFPQATQYRDVCSFAVVGLPAPEYVDVLCGGPPCQSWSVAGKQKGFEDPRGQLSHEYLRIVNDLLPRFVVIENVPGYKKAMPSIVGSLLNLGYTVQWDILPAAAVGAPHLRKRIFVVGMRDSGMLLDFHQTRPEAAWDELDVYPTKMPKGKTDSKRIRALGNAVVPQVGAWVARSLSNPFSFNPEEHEAFGELTPAHVPVAGYATLDGEVYELETAGGVFRGTTESLPTPTATTADTKGYRGLAGMLSPGMLPTPVRQDGNNNSLPPSQADWASVPGAVMRAGYRGYLNPDFVEWMMGFERGWTDI